MELPNYYATRCRRAAEYKVRRIQRHLERLETQRESPLFAEGAEVAIATLEARLRILLDDGAVPESVIDRTGGADS